MEGMADAALARGLTALCFTEHEDRDFPATLDPEGLFDLDTETYYAEWAALRDRYAGQLALFFGVELGMQPHLASFNSAFVSMHDFDFVIASQHLMHGEDPYHSAFFDTLGTRIGTTDPRSVEEEAMRTYLDALYENLTLFEEYDVVGHLDLINRYFPSGNRAYHYETHAARIDDILRLIIQAGKGLDCNTNLIWKGGADEMNPSRHILSRFRELGGRIITFGSDAHDPSHVGDAFDTARAIARASGFTEYCTFAKRNAQFHPL